MSPGNCRDYRAIRETRKETGLKGFEPLTCGLRVRRYAELATDPSLLDLIMWSILPNKGFGVLRSSDPKLEKNASAFFDEIVVIPVRNGVSRQYLEFLNTQEWYIFCTMPPEAPFEQPGPIKYCIFGCGTNGYNIILELAKENERVVVVDKDESRVRHLRDQKFDAYQRDISSQDLLAGLPALRDRLCHDR